MVLEEEEAEEALGKGVQFVDYYSYKHASVHKFIRDAFEVFSPEKQVIEIKFRNAKVEVSVRNQQPTYDEMVKLWESSGGQLPLHDAVFVVLENGQSSKADGPQRASYGKKTAPCRHGLLRAGGSYKKREGEQVKPWKFTCADFPSIHVILMVPFSRSEDSQSSGKRKFEDEVLEDERVLAVRRLVESEEPTPLDDAKVHAIEHILTIKREEDLKQVFDSLRARGGDGGGPQEQDFRGLECLITSVSSGLHALTISAPLGALVVT